jgi:hypothetical protein
MEKDIDYDDYYGTLQYYGVWDVAGNFYVDIERFDKTIGFYINDVEYVKSLADDDGILYPNDEKPKHYDMIIKELSNLRSMWRNEYLPLLNCIKTPKQVEDDTRLSMLCYTSDMDDFDEICSESMIAGAHRMIAYNNILRTIYLQYFSMTISKCEQLIYKLICDCGYTDDEFSFQKYLEFLKKKNINNDDLANSQEFDGMRKIYNFLKHGTKDTFNKLKKAEYANDHLLKKEYDKDITPIEYINLPCDLLSDAFILIENYLLSLCEVLTGENSLSKYKTKEYYIDRVSEIIETV